MATELQRQCGRDLLLDGRFFHICCFKYLNVIVKDGLKAMKGAIHRIQETIKFLKSSQAKPKTFIEIVKQLKMNAKKRICINIPTCWSSTYLILNNTVATSSRMEVEDYRKGGAHRLGL